MKKVLLSFVIAHIGTVLAQAYAADSRVLLLSTFGTAGEGKDDTAVFQKALNAAAVAGQILEIPSSPAPYNVRPLQIPNNSKLVVDANVIIQATPGYAEEDHLINIKDVSNVSITGTPGQTIFRMLKPEYTSGEYRHCLAIAGANNVKISGIECNDSGGDGLYISGGSQGYSSNIEVVDSSFDNNRRQGFSLISGRHIRISNCRFTNTKGTDPSDGIDIEPNREIDSLQDINIENSTASGNAGNGITFGLSKLSSRSLPISITVTGYHSAKNKESGFFASNGHDDADPPVSGTVLVTDSSSTEDAKYGAVASYWDAGGASLTFKNLKVVNANQSRTNIDNAAIAIKRGGDDKAYMGNVHFFGTSISDTASNIDVYFTVWDWSHVGIRQVQFLEPQQLSGAKHPNGLYEGKPVKTIDCAETP